MLTERPVFPFSAIVGQEKSKLCLILNVVDPKIGGALLTGTKGTGKSTVVRAVAGLLPEIEVVAGCPFNCNPADVTNMCAECRQTFESGEDLPRETRRMKIVQLPLGATEDRVIGTFDLEKAFQEGKTALQPGLLAEANQNILYIDEVNLLSDHLTDSILDVAASGWNVVQREGISVIHPSRFALFGSMNPQEGDLRPQILDRFPLHAKAENLSKRDDRVNIIDRNMAFEEDPICFLEKYEKEQEELRRRILNARKILSEIIVPDHVCDGVAKVCAELQVDGHRPDIVAIRAAKSLAAFNERTDLRPEDVFLACSLALSHRTRKRGLMPPPTPTEIQEALARTPEFSPFFEDLTEKAQTHLETPQAFPVLGQVEIPGIGTIEPGETAKLAEPLEPPGPLRLRKAQRRLTAIVTMILIYFVLPFLFFLLSAFMILLFVFPLDSTPNGGSLFPFPLVGGRRFLAVASAVAGLVIYLIILKRRRHKIPVVYFPQFTAEVKGRLPRKIVSQLTEAFEDAGEPPSSALLPDHGTVLDKMYKTIWGLGKKIASTIQELAGLLKSRATFELSLERLGRGASKRAKRVTTLQKGRYVWFDFPSDHFWDIAFAPTIRAAVSYRKERLTRDLTLKIEPQDIRVKVREYRPPNCILLLLDMSESMATSLDNVREAILSLHETAYRHRDSIGLIVFKGTEAIVLQHPTTNLILLVKRLLEIGASDYTPLAAGMIKARHLLQVERRRNKDIIPILVIISDGIVNVPLERPISPFRRKQFTNPSQADAIDVAHQLAKDNVRTIVINTDHRQEEVNLQRGGSKIWYSPADFLMEIVKITRGRYYGLDVGKEIEKILLTQM